MVSAPVGMARVYLRARAPRSAERCSYGGGASANKPYCDGGHKRIGFKS